MRYGFATLAGMALAAGVSSFGASAAAQQADHAGHSDRAADACAAGGAAVPEALQGWSSRRPVVAAGDAPGLRAATLEVGAAADATLRSTADMRYIVRPEKPGGSVSYGGLFSVVIDRAGTYRVGLGSGAWIDVLKGKKAVMSSAHGPGPACSGVRKMVDFPLTPGRYVIQIAANGEPVLPMMIARLP